MDFEKICRLCLSPSKQTYDIFTSFCLKRNILYLEMITYSTKIMLSEGDGLPKLICKECIKLLKKAYSFNLQCENSDLKLRHYLESLTNLQDVGTNTQYEDNTQSDHVGIKDESDVKDTFDLILGNDPEQKVLELLDQNVQNDKEEIKIELNCKDEDDSCWDADDDMLLGQIKSNKDNHAQENGEKPKKKRGRKKRESSGPVPSKTPHQCDICGKVLSTKSNLKAHKVCHTDLKPYECKECSASFRGHSALFQHRRMHSGETPYHCEYCPKQFSRRSGLVNHVRTHTGEKLYRCEVCLRAFIQSAQLNVHMRRHKGDKPFLCQDCGKGFAMKADLKVHQRTHSGERPYACHLCTKTFGTAGNLAIHIRIHNKEIRYTCSSCDRGFVTSSAYNVHLKRHKGQRDYPCECGKDFYTLSSLKQHQTVHTGEKKYQCKICERKFTQTSHLSRHFKKDHAKPNLPIPSSDSYKIVLTDLQTGRVFKLIDTAVPKIDAVNVNV